MIEEFQAITNDQAVDGLTLPLGREDTEGGSAASYWAAECRKQLWPQLASSSPTLRIADLFSGCGGLSLGALLASVQLNKNIKIALAADMWPDAMAVFKTNFGPLLNTAATTDLSSAVEHPGSVVLSRRGKELAKAAGDIDVVLAGPPCQGHSDLNNASRRDDPRNSLYTIPVGFALHKNAQLLIVENVPTVIHSTGQVVASAFDALAANNYSVREYVADAQDFGLPQTRKRHLLIASRIHTAGQLDRALNSIPRRKQDVPIWPFIADLEHEPIDPARPVTKQSTISEDNQSRIKYLFDMGVFDLPNRLRPPCHRDKKHSYVSMYGRLNANRPAQTITSGFGSMGQGRFVHPTQRRMITPHEAARIQGFPDYFDFAPVEKLTSLREMIGNAVAPPVAAVLLYSLLSTADR
jgi:DNA (cytosine-5)-methyltransferase 1